MVGKEECMEIWLLRRQGFSVRAIARRVGLDRRTVKKYLEAGEFPRYSTVNRASALQPYYGLIEDWLSREDYQATRLYEILLMQGYRGNYETVERYVRKVRERRVRTSLKIAGLPFEVPT